MSLLIFFGPIFTYLLMLVLGVPVFLLFYKLQWWHAASVGLLVSLAFTWFVGRSTNPFHAEMYGLSEDSLYLAAGYTTAVLFWFIAL